MNTPTRNVTLSSVRDDGTKVPFVGSGIRVHLGRNQWAGIDFDLKAASGMSIRIFGRCGRRDVDEMPRLAVVPKAGNVATVEFGAGHLVSDWALQVLQVEPAEGDFESLHEEASRSGDRMREALWESKNPTPIPFSRFSIDFGELAVVDLSIQDGPDVALRIDVNVHPKSEWVRGTMNPALGMFLQFGAANVVLFQFYETEVACG